MLGKPLAQAIQTFQWKRISDIRTGPPSPRRERFPPRVNSPRVLLYYDSNRAFRGQPILGLQSPIRNRSTHEIGMRILCSKLFCLVNCPLIEEPALES